jgi:co-chaperonin GroES (HSP10)
MSYLLHFTIIILIFVPIMKGRPPKNRCLVLMDEVETTSGGIILLPEAAVSNTGLVVQSAIENVAEGSKVALNDDPLQMITIDDRDYASVHLNSILLIQDKDGGKWKAL